MFLVFIFLLFVFTAFLPSLKTAVRADSGEVG